MTTAFARRAAIVGLCLLFVAVILLLAPSARVAASPSGTLEACVNPGNGMMRLVGASVACHANETRVEWNIAGPAGPPGPPGPQGPAGDSAGGPPFVWVCTPASFPLAAGSPRADLYVFNGSSSTANIAVHMLDKDGNNLVGVTIPGSSPPMTYPGQTGSSTVALAAGSTQDLSWVLPQTGGSGFDGATNVSFTVTVTSDQPIAVGTDLQFSGFHATPCSLLPK